MFGFLKKLMGAGQADLSQLLQNGAVVVDVRSKGEFSSGHAKGSINIPLELIESKAKELKKHPHVIVCCRSGNRSGMAQRMLEAKGLSNVTNGGSWQNVNQYIKQ